MDNLKKTDARIIKTRRDLRESLLRIIEKKPFDKINVSEICADAMVNRMTFYKHYNDKYDLLNDVILDIKNKVLAKLEMKYPHADIETDSLNYVLNLIEMVVDECMERRLIANFFLEDGLIMTMVATTIEKFSSELLIQIDKKYHLRYSVDMLSAAMAGGASFLINYWLNHQPEKNKETFLSNLKSFFQDLFNSNILFKEKA